MKERKRAARILKAVTEATLSFAPDKGLGAMAALSVQALAKSAAVAPNNASTELNLLHRAGILLKVSGRPAHYLSLAHLETLLGRAIPSTSLTLRDFLLFLGPDTPGPPHVSDSFSMTAGSDSSRTLRKEGIKPSEQRSAPRFRLHVLSAFDTLIGTKHSLAPLIKQAKAAMLYPPAGLHTLITGTTGTGKSQFARCMYDFALKSGVRPRHAAFVTLNCANYADNPQLLLSQLFGYVRGAYTGAERDQPGLVERAHEGILFLDEIHRLSPEGQEKLFLLMDQGVFSRLGEAKSPRAARVLIIGATTENPLESMLATFLRRIPMHIVLPPLEERSFEERVTLILRFLWQESRSVNRPVGLSADVMQALCFYNCSANIGQLASDIKLTCANAWYDCLYENGESMRIGLEHRAERVRQGLLISTRRRASLLDNLLSGGEMHVDGRQEFSAVLAELLRTA